MVGGNMIRVAGPTGLHLYLSERIRESRYTIHARRAPVQNLLASSSYWGVLPVLSVVALFCCKGSDIPRPIALLLKGEDRLTPATLAVFCFLFSVCCDAALRVSACRMLACSCVPNDLYGSQFFGVWELWEASAQLLRTTLGAELVDSADLDPAPENAMASS